ncbi:MAG: hypothetical protein ACUVQP_07490 [Bacteroidales bacterium]
MFGISFFKLPKAKQFNYKPVYYDPTKEEFEQHSNKKDVQPQAENSFKENIKGSFRKNRQKSKTADIRKMNIRLILITIALGILALYFMYS